MTRPVVAIKPLGMFANPRFVQMKSVSREEGAAPSFLSPDLVFEMDDVGSSAGRKEDDPLDAALAARISSIFQPRNMAEVELHKAVKLAAQAFDGHLARLADSLARSGYTVKTSVSSAAAKATQGSFLNLRHEFLTVFVNGDELVVDPSFKDQFMVLDPTQRFKDVLQLIPDAAVVIPALRVMRAVTVLASELARSFKVRGVALAPWRQAESFLSKWEEAETSSGPKLRCKIPTAGGGDKRASPGTDSPTSVLGSEASPSVAAHPVIVGFKVAGSGHKCFCCRLRSKFNRMQRPRSSRKERRQLLAPSRRGYSALAA